MGSSVFKGALGAIAWVLVGCGTTQMTPNGPALPPRPESCEFGMFTAPPPAGYAEIGVIDVKPGPYGGNVYSGLDDFKREIQPYVCRAGGDAALAFIDGGVYMKATVLKMVNAPPPVAAPQPATDSGCHYDTQCKGTRICVKGECVEPSPAAAPAAPAAGVPAAP